MLKKLLKTLKNNKGNGYPLAIAVTLAILMLLVVISEYFHLMIVTKGIREALEDAVISTVTENYDNVYHGVREGYSGGYQPTANSFNESLDYGDIYNKLDKSLGLVQNGNKHIKYIGENIEFYVSDLKVDIRNAPFAGGDIRSQRFKIDSSIVLNVPISFAGKILPNMQIRIKNTAGYTPIF